MARRPRKLGIGLTQRSIPARQRISLSNPAQKCDFPLANDNNPRASLFAPFVPLAPQVLLTYSESSKYSGSRRYYHLGIFRSSVLRPSIRKPRQKPGMSGSPVPWRKVCSFINLSWFFTRYANISESLELRAGFRQCLLNLRLPVSYHSDIPVYRSLV